MKIFIIAGEQSGDQLGVKIMRALREQRADVVFAGVGGEAMCGEGLDSLFPLADIAVMGFGPVIARLPALLSRIRQTAQAVCDWQPDILLLIDSPDFTHRVARRVRRAHPHLCVVDYVSPTVWAWRPGRAKAMRSIIDHVLALLPFEPAAHFRLGGPACTYVGHPLIERLTELRPNEAESLIRRGIRPQILVLPGSRRSELERLMPIFGAAIARLAERLEEFDLILPAVSHLEATVRRLCASWPVQPQIVLGEAAKLAAFRRARVALAASGTVTLELALAGVPMVVAYRLNGLEQILRVIVTAPSIVLPNLILGENIIPEFIQADCTAQNLAQSLSEIIPDGGARSRQLDGLARLDARMQLPDDDTPSTRAARITLAIASK